MSRTEQLTEFDARAVREAEADLDLLLSIEPSPEFAAKVRARIAAEPRVRTWNWRLVLLPLGAAAVLVFVVTLVTNRNGRDAEPPFTTARHDDIVLPGAKVNHAPADVPATIVVNNRPTVRRAIASPQAEPEIIIDPAITDAIRRLALAARNTTLDGSKDESIAAPDSASETLPIAADLNVPELVLKPADQTGGQ
jgi:hypothetical protein